MRIVVLGSAVLAAALFGSRPTPAAAAGPWCYFNEEVHCTEVSFEMCHFATMGNGGYCFPNPYSRRYLEPQPAAALRTGPGYDHWYGWPVDYGYPDYRQQTIATRSLYGWCPGWGRCALPFPSYTFGGFGYAAYWHDSGYFGGGYGWGRRFVHHRRHHYRPREAIASARAGEQFGTGEPSQRQPDVGDPHLAMASADPQATVSIESPTSTSRDKGTTAAAKTRAGNGVPVINVVPSCRAGMSLGLDQNIDACLADEASARDQLARDWDQVPPIDRAKCARVATVGGGGSYTALLSCIEMKRDARKLSTENTSVLLTGR